MDQTKDARFEDALSREDAPAGESGQARGAARRSPLDLIELLADSLPAEAQPPNGFSIEWLLNQAENANRRI